jgi:hypothetical protein
MLMRRAPALRLLLAAWAATAACRDAPALRALDTAIELAPRTLEFAPVYVSDGTSPPVLNAVPARSLTATLTNRGEHPVTLHLDCDAGAFTVAPAVVELATGGAATVTVTFAPTTAGPHAGALHVVLDGGPTIDAALRGDALPVPTCDDGNPCTDHAFDAATAACLALAHDRPCDDGDACTEGDRCAAELCAGTSITCDDGEECTADACDTALGCTTTPIVTGPICDPCLDLEEGAPCGSCDLVAACRGGHCEPVPGLTTCAGSPMLDPNEPPPLESYGSCDIVNGTVYVRDATDLTALARLRKATTLSVDRNPGLTSLAALGALRCVGSLVLRDNDQLATLAGLEGLTTIRDGLIVERNAQLTDLGGLRGVRGTLRNIYIEDNARLVDLAGLDGVERLSGIANSSVLALIVDGNPELLSLGALSGVRGEVGGSMSIRLNPKLESLDGLQGVTRLTGGLLLHDNGLATLSHLAALSEVEALTIEERGLVDLTGLEGLERVGGDGMYVIGATQLVSLRGLEALARIDGRLFVTSNPALVELAGLEHLVEIGGDLVVQNNDALTSLAALDALTHLGGALSAVSNAVLPACEIESLAARTGVSCSCSGNDDDASCE